MNPIWRLPSELKIGDRKYKIHGDYRDILEIFSYFENPDLPGFLKWRIALKLFYDEEIPDAYFEEACHYLSWFIRCGQEENSQKFHRVLDWQQDAPAIIADINKVSGKEIRSLPFLHWWTFMAYFHGIGQGQLSFIVSLREKIRRGKKLEPWEREFYAEHKKQIDIRMPLSSAEQEEQRKLLALLGGAEVQKKVTT